MKLKIIIGLLLSALLIGMTACKTTPTGSQQIDPATADKLAPILSGSVAGAVIYAQNKNTNTVTYVTAIKVAIDEFLLQTNLSPAHLQATLYNLPIKELKTPEAQLIISPLLATYQGFADRPVKDAISKDAGLVVLLKAISDGLAQGLDGIKHMNSATPPGAYIPNLEALDIVCRTLRNRMFIEAQKIELAEARQLSSQEVTLLEVSDQLIQQLNRVKVEQNLR